VTVPVFVPTPRERCRFCGVNEVQARNYLCHRCERDHRRRERRQRHEALYEGVRHFTKGQGVLAKIAGRERRAEFLAAYFVDDFQARREPEVLLRYWLADGTTRERLFRVSVAFGEPKPRGESQVERELRALLGNGTSS